MLHGAGGNPEVSEQATGWAAKGRAEGFYVCYPQALALDPDKPISMARNPSLWRRDDLPFLDAMLDEILEQHPNIDPARVYLSGFSNGASFAFTAGAALAERIAAIGVVAGKQWHQHIEMTRPVPALYICGDQDPLNPLDGGTVYAPWGQRFDHPPVWEGLWTWAVMLGCPRQPETIDDGHIRRDRYGPGADGSELLVQTIRGAGHHWPGGVPVLSEKLAGRPSDAFNATDVIWEFLSRWTRSEQVSK